MLRRSERLRVQAKVARLEQDDPDRWAAVSFLLEELADAEQTIDLLIQTAARALAYGRAEGDRVRAHELTEERGILAALVSGAMPPEDAAQLSPADFTSDARRSLAATALACHEADYPPTAERVLRVLCLDGEGSALAVAGGVEIERLPHDAPAPDLPSFLTQARARRACALTEQATRALRLRAHEPAREALWAALALLEDS